MRSRTIKKKLVKENWSHFDAIKSKAIQMTVSLTGDRFTPTEISTFTWEVDTAEIIFELVDEDKKPIILDNIRHSTIAWGFLTETNQIINSHPIFSNAEVISAQDGLIRTTIPADMLHIQDPNWRGRILGEIAIRFADERRFVGGRFLTMSHLSLMDIPLSDDVIRWYIRTFDDMLDYLENMSNDMVTTLTNNANVVAERIGAVEGQATAIKNRVDQIEQRAEDADAVMHGELAQMGFGENNLIPDSHIPIIINPAGNVATAFHAFDLPEGPIDFSFQSEALFLQGGSEGVITGLRYLNPASAVTSWETLPIVDGKISRSFTALPPQEGRPQQLLIYAGNNWDQTQGNTLQITNPMLTKGTLPQPPRRNDMDDFNRLERLETLKSNTRRTVATFEGKVVGSNVENPHHIQANTTSVNLLNPTGGGFGFNQGAFDGIMRINSRRTVSLSNSINAIAQQRFEFNIIEHITRTYSEAIWQGFTSIEDRVRIAREIVSGIACVWDGHGQTNGVPWVRLMVANSLTTWTTGGQVTHTNSISQRLNHTSTLQTSINSRILNDGTVRWLVHTAEGQETPIGGAILTTAYVEFRVDVNLTLAHTDWSYSKAESDMQLANLNADIRGDMTTQNINEITNNSKTANDGPGTWPVGISIMRLSSAFDHGFPLVASLIRTERAGTDRIVQWCVQSSNAHVFGIQMRTGTVATGWGPWHSIPSMAQFTSIEKETKRLKEVNQRLYKRLKSAEKENQELKTNLKKLFESLGEEYEVL